MQWGYSKTSQITHFKLNIIIIIIIIIIITIIIIAIIISRVLDQTGISQACDIVEI